MRLFDDEPVRTTRTDAGWEQHREHRSGHTGPPQDEVGVLALASFVLARTDEVAIAERGVTAYSDGLVLSAVVLFADEQKAEDLAWSLQDFGKSPGRFRLGCAYADGRRATTGRTDSPDLEKPDDPEPHLVLLSSTAQPLTWTADYWLHPLPPGGPIVLGCRWPDRRIAETLAQLESEPLLAACESSRPVWEQSS